MTAAVPPVADRLRRGLFVVTAEQTHPAQAPRYARLIERGAVDAVTLPDIPLVGRLGDAVRLFARRERPKGLFDVLDETREPVVTISAGTRTRSTVEARILRAVGGGARGLLVLSGGDLVRRGLATVPGGASLLPMDAFRTLELVRRLRESGQLPPELPVWAVENPLVGRVEARVDRLARKIDAGAEAILLQPPLLWERHEAWWERAHARGLTSTPLVVGVPVIGSAAMLRFWLFLIGCGTRSPEARALLGEYRAAEGDLDEEEFTAFKRRWSADLIGRIRRLPGAAGIHLMPISGTADLLPVLSAAGLAPSERARSDVDLLSADLGARGVSVVHEPGLRDDGYVRSFRGALRSLERVVEAGAGGPAFRTYWNRITYAQHFRVPIAYRPFVGPGGEPEETWELALDVRQLDTGPALEEAVAAALRRREAGSTESEGGAVIGGWVPYSRSPVWEFNETFWRHMRAYVGTHGRDYRDSISGSPDSDVELVRANARRFLEQVVEARGDDPDAELAYVEIGVSSVDYAREFIDTVTRFARAGRLEPGRLCYVLVDAAPASLEAAREELGERRRGFRLDYVQANLQAPTAPLERYRGRVLRVHVTSVVNNLPNDKLAQIDGECFAIETRLYLPGPQVELLSEEYGLDEDLLREDLEAIGRSGVSSFLDLYRDRFRENLGEEEGDFRFYHFWQDLYGNPEDRGTGLKLEERYVHIPDLGRFSFLDPERLSGLPLDPAAILREVLDEYPPNVWMHLSNRSIEGCLLLIDLLHPRGALELIDLIVRVIADYHEVPQRRNRRGRSLYRMGFKGPAKFDGSAVDWFNGRLFEAAARQAFPGCRVSWSSLEEYGRPHMSLMEVLRS
ncbi:MAG: hypothetical protein OXG13_06115 [Gemmatimonadaceae bacterium]|nr:hypothetical protein [Gemmatimonadaceae bacterium]